MAKKRTHKQPSKRRRGSTARDPRQGDSRVGLPGVLDIVSEADYKRAYPYPSEVTPIRTR
jgi:hypothetical protein